MTVGHPVRTAAMLLLATLPLLASAELYKWTDADGKVHYSDHNPGNTPAQTVPMPKVDKLNPTAKGQTGRDAVKDAVDKANAATRQGERQKDDTEETLRRQRRCSNARANYQYWYDRRPYTFNQGTGDKVYTREPYNQQRLQEAQAEIREYCR